MAASKNVAPTRLYVEVVQQIIAQIVSGEFPPGTALPSESEMSEQFGVSRTVIREALRILDQKGLIEVKHGSGSRVREPERWDPLDPLLVAAQLEHGESVTVMHDLIEARTILESQTVALAALRAEPIHLEQMEQALTTMARSLEDPPRYAAADALFHRTIMEAARNKVLLRMAQPVGELLEFTVGMTDSGGSTLKRALREHNAIFRAIKRRDAEGAREAMLVHLAKTQRDLSRILHAKTNAGQSKEAANELEKALA